MHTERATIERRAFSHARRRLIPFLNSIGNVGGFVGPYAIGFVKDATGRFEAGLLALAGILALGGVLALLAPRPRRS